MYRHLVKPPFLSAFESTKSTGVINIRTYKSGVNIEWKPPPILPCYHKSKSGDKGNLPEVDQSRLTYQFASAPSSSEFQKQTDISDQIKKLATLEFAPRRMHTQVIKQDFLSLVKRHSLDTGSIEATIAALTVDIRNQQKYLEKNRTNKNTKVACKENIDRRKALLKHLRKYDYKRFEWLLEKLDLVYHSTPNPIEPVTRKGSLIKLTKIYCDKIRDERLEAYKKELQEQKEEFIKEKEETEKWIKEEERKLGLSS